MVLRDDARLFPCGSHLWAMQPMWSTATLVTLITLWLPYRFTLVSETDTCQAAGSYYLTDNPGNIHKVATTGKFDALDGNK